MREKCRLGEVKRSPQAKKMQLHSCVSLDYYSSPIMLVCPNVLSSQSHIPSLTYYHCSSVECLIVYYVLC